MMRKILRGNFEKSFLGWEKMTSREIFHTCSTQIFIHVCIISNHTVFLVQFGISLLLWVFQKFKLKLHSPKGLVQFQLFEKLTDAHSKLNSKSYNKNLFSQARSSRFFSVGLQLLKHCDQGVWLWDIKFIILRK